MPIYEYRCSACDHLTELLLGINDPAPQFCPSCGAEGTMRKAFAPPAIVFKGSGWAKKDRSTTATKAAKDDGGSASKDDGSKPDATRAEPKADAPAKGSGSGAAASDAT